MQMNVAGTDVTPGSEVTVEVKSRVTREAAEKTLTRVFMKNHEVSRKHRRMKELRPSWQEWRRGGKMWHHQMKTKMPVSTAPGAQYRVRATVDVIRDLQSVEEFVKVS